MLPRMLAFLDWNFRETWVDVKNHKAILIIMLYYIGIHGRFLGLSSGFFQV
jgi:hypothetical protein